MDNSPNSGQNNNPEGILQDSEIADTVVGKLIILRYQPGKGPNPGEEARPFHPETIERFAKHIEKQNPQDPDLGVLKEALKKLREANPAKPQKAETALALKLTAFTL